MTLTEVEALQVLADQLGLVKAVLREFGGDEGAVDRQPATVLRELLETWRFMSRRGAATPVPPEPTAAHFPVGFAPTLAQLVPGVTVRRYTTHDRDYADTEIPCCGRPVRLPLDPGLAPHFYACPFCGKAYAAVLVDEGDGDDSYAAVFTVRPETFTVAGRHKPRRSTR